MGLFTERDEETTNEIIIGKLNRIEAKLDAIIKAIHEYDDSEYGESSFEAFMETQGGPCSRHDAASWNEEEMEQRMNIIGQNGNEGLHYNMGVENDNNDIQDNERVGEKKRNKRKYYKPKNKG
jgi:hypothetical protein